MMYVVTTTKFVEAANSEEAMTKSKRAPVHEISIGIHSGDWERNNFTLHGRNKEATEEKIGFRQGRKVL